MTNIRQFRIEGLVGAPVTPFKDNGDVDVDAIPPYIQHFVDFGVRNAFVTGSNGEGQSMTVAERKQFVEAWVREAKGKLKVNLVHIGAGNVRDSQELARHAQEIGVDAIACVAPTYHKPRNVEELVEFMRQVASAAPNLPFYLYDCQYFTGLQISSDVFLDLARDRIPTMRGVKHTTPDFISMSNILRKHGDYFQVLMGSEEMYVQGLSIGVDGNIVCTYAGHALNRLKEAFDKGDFVTARKEQDRSIEIGDIRRKGGFSVPGGTKAILKTIGLELGKPRPPCNPLSQQEYEQLKKDLDDIGFFQWGTKK